MREFDEFMEVVREIRKKCPWDSVQTHESLKECLVNETEEVLEGIDLFRETGDSGNFCEELGDLLMLVILQSEIARILPFRIPIRRRIRQRHRGNRRPAHPTPATQGLAAVIAQYS